MAFIDVFAWIVLLILIPAGVAAIFTDHVKASHIIREVALRQTAILNYVNLF